MGLACGFVQQYAAMVDNIPQLSREALWDENLQWTRDILERNLPAMVRLVDPATQKSIFKNLLSDRRNIFLQFAPEQMPTDPKDLIQELVDRIVEEHNLVPRLRDEDLVRLFVAGYSHAGDALAIRYLPKIKETVRLVVLAHNLCPYSDVEAFIEDVTSVVALILVTKLHTYKFKKPLEHWINSICKKTAISAARKETGRSKKGPRKYDSIGEYMVKPVRTVKPEHLDILKRIFEEHGKTKRGRKSNSAIQLSYRDGLTAKEVAKRLRTTPGYVNQLISHDYPRLRKISIDGFGFTGTDI